MSSKFLRQLVAEYLRKPDHIVEILRIEQLPTRESALEDRRAQHRSSRVQCSGHSRWARTDDDNVVITHFRQGNHLKDVLPVNRKHAEKKCYVRNGQRAKYNRGDEPLCAVSNERDGRRRR